MRATRNATKNTPPPAKKAGKATTPVATRASTVEKPEQDPKPEPILIVEEETTIETVTVEIKEESAADANGADAAEKAKETPKAKPASAKKKVATPKSKASEDAEKPADAVKAEASKSSSAKTLTQQLKPEATSGTEVEANEEDLEMEDEEEGDEEGAEEDEEGEGAENDEEAEEEDGEGEENVAEEDGEGDGEEELVEPRPVTERQKRKKLEIFVGGLHKEATEDDIKAAFSAVGEVVEVRLMRNTRTGKNKGYAFVRFANADQAKRAATELEKTKILEKECAVVASDEDDTLFVGNICKSWKREQVLEKLKEYEIEGIEEMTLMDDPKNEGSNRGFAFLELASHNDAVKAFKMLCRPIAIFGTDRSAKVAWAEPGEPDEEVMAKVKSVFVNGMPSSWDEAKLRELFETYGEVESVVLAKNMPRSKRKEYGFVNYATREAAVASIEALKDAELPDGEDTVKLKVALAKPAPRKKYMKGSRGGYPIGSSGEPVEQGKGLGTRGGRSGSKRGRVGKGSSRGVKAGSGKKVKGEASTPKIVKASKQKGGDTKSEEKSRDKASSGARGARKKTRGGATRLSRGGYSKPSWPSNDFSSQRGRGAARQGGVALGDDYMPRGARLTPGLLRTRGFAARPLPREDPYSRRLDRAYGRDADVGYGSAVYDYAEAGPGVKRPFSVLGEDAAYYEAGRRGFPRARIDYADHVPAGGSHFTESIRAPLGRTSLQGRSTLSAGGGSLGTTGSGALYGSGGPGYSLVLSGGGDYVSGVGELRGGSYSSVYGSRTGSGYGLPGGGSGSYY